MSKFKITATLFALVICIYCKSQDQSKYPLGVQRLLKAYPTTIVGYNNGNLILTNGQTVRYTESKISKTHIELISSDVLGDIFAYPYTTGVIKHIKKNSDPGRIRNENLLKKMYGTSAAAVQKNLITIVWCPKLINQKIRVTRVNGVDKQLQKISDELDQHPELKDFLQCSGTFLWRNVRGANRLSAHSFGTAIDISVKYSNYWQWDCKCNSEEKDLAYKNRIPQKIVNIFEKHGFIWGGKWYHYDTMHFEYRPELIE